MPLTIIAFESSPDQGQGFARDMFVRWALEEVNQSYEVRFLSMSEMKESAHRKHHPFGKIPTYEDGALALFESGAIVFHIAQSHAGLLPDEAESRASRTRLGTRRASLSWRIAFKCGWANSPVGLAMTVGSMVLRSAQATC